MISQGYLPPLEIVPSTNTRGTSKPSSRAHSATTDHDVVGMTHDTGAIVVLEDWALLSELFVMYETPDFIRSDNGPEFIADAIREWLGRLSVQTLYVEPGSPWENGYAESFHSRVRDELFRVEEFSNVSHARARCHAWREDYNDYRPHSSLGGLPPSEFALPPPSSFTQTLLA